RLKVLALSVLVVELAAADEHHFNDSLARLKSCPILLEALHFLESDSMALALDLDDDEAPITLQCEEVVALRITFFCSVLITPLLKLAGDVLFPGEHLPLRIDDPWIVRQEIVEVLIADPMRRFGGIVCEKIGELVDDLQSTLDDLQNRSALQDL